MTATAMKTGEASMSTMQQPHSQQDEQQPNLLDLIVAARDEAINRVEAHADTQWKDVAYVTAIRVAERQRFLTSEEVWDALPRGVHTHEPRAMGPIMRRLRKENIVEPTDQFVISTSPLGHGRPSRVWRSLLDGASTSIGEA